ncbi:hypothetical protein FM821_13400 [Listeria monocytogenes]|nr:hypothetical protein [Listeria monocytogenes]ECC0879623.1 hypothetical protein [Listeria monocytogenes]ECC0891841.1 hypothetical protein [Listeria monocytogenes]ECC0894943.1 hypothetical protein [Listeria monocytogenes]
MKRYALYIEECKYISTFEKELNIALITTDVTDALKFTSFEEANETANALNKNIVMVIEVTNLKSIVEC